MAKRWRFYINGTVQGVGFRPFIFNLARKNALTGFVENNCDGVCIEIQSHSNYNLEQFCEEMLDNLPPLAQISKFDKIEITPLTSETEFCIQHTKNKTDKQSNSFPNLPPCDSATCKQCLSEFFDSNNRRYRYPFINCTNCGPRFTIINELPYDRASTTMSLFNQCKECLNEYNDPLDRRFHAQPNACSNCGPQIFLEPGACKQDAALARTVELLNASQIIALKGLGGFQLLCDAHDQIAVKQLRERKKRPHKPFAVMFSDIEQIKKHCHINEVEKTLLLSKESPIVLLTKKTDFSLAPNICFNNHKLGAMLPATPLHHALLRDFKGPIVATSGNTTEEPIAYKNEEAKICLASIADAFLLNDRDIISRYDDSVITVHQNQPIMIRRARGFTPFTIELPFESKKQILALGGHLKSTFCIGKNKQAILSQHLGDLDDAKSLDNFVWVLDHYQKLFDFKPDLIARDFHPDYISTRLSTEISSRLNISSIAVQHHHAHIAACMAEHKISRPVLGVAMDGLGMGLDETIWGGEFFYCNFNEKNQFERLAHFKPVAMPGGTAAIKEPWRMMLGLIESFSDKNKEHFCQFIERISSILTKEKITVIKKQIEQEFNSPYTSSCGRLFDAAAALLDVCSYQSFEGQAPSQLESLAQSAVNKSRDSFEFEVKNNGDTLSIDMESVFTGMASDISKNIPTAIISLKFHQTIKNIVVQLCRDLGKKYDCKSVCLSGGVFQNQLLLSLVEHDLINEHFQVYYPQKIPTNDGGLSLGQLVIAANSI